VEKIKFVLMARILKLPFSERPPFRERDSILIEDLLSVLAADGVWNENLFSSVSLLQENVVAPS
jgi:hypothetical protein